MANLTLVQFEARIAAMLIDPAYSVFTAATIDAGLRLALSDYTARIPLTKETVITCPGAGREIALSDLTDLIDAVDVWYPYDSTADEVWPPSRVTGFTVYWDDARPVLFLSAPEQDQPQTDDEIRLWYTTPHTVQNLDSAAVTTIPAQHESLVVTGAGGYACFLIATQAARTITVNRFEAPNYMEMSQRLLEKFHADFNRLAHTSQNQSNPQVAFWTLDKYDGME